jgi:predicted ATP-grasp superfamily ATP-dependent carboligase
MNEHVDLWETPSAGKYLIAGWRQWADAGSVSSGLPQYLIELTGASKIGQIRSDDFYLFQLPGAHHLLRPEVKLAEGYPQAMGEPLNEFFRASGTASEFVVFLGEEPQRNERQYAEAFFDAVDALGVGRVAAMAGVHAPVPYDRDREVSSVYSLPHMKEELERYAVRFSNYEGGTTISMYLASEAEPRGIEFFRFCAMVPCYDFTVRSSVVERMAMHEDYRAWYDLMRRLVHMFNLDVDLADLEAQGTTLTADWQSKIERLHRAMPQLKVHEYLEQVNEEFTAEPYDPLSGAWGDALRDVLTDDEGL